MVSRIGTNGDDTLLGTSEEDILNGLGGNDSLVGLGNIDLLLGFEGESFYAYPIEIGAQIAGTIPIFRFFNTATGAHFYTLSVAEKNNIEATLPDFQSEGIAYYAFPAEEI